MIKVTLRGLLAVCSVFVPHGGLRKSHAKEILKEAIIEFC